MLQYQAGGAYVNLLYAGMAALSSRRCVAARECAVARGDKCRRPSRKRGEKRLALAKVAVARDKPLINSFSSLIGDLSTDERRCTVFLR